jgi:HlyD family secretion protein
MNRKTLMNNTMLMNKKILVEAALKDKKILVAAAAVALTTTVIVALLLPADRMAASVSGSTIAGIGIRDRAIAASGLVEPASEARQLSATVVGRLIKVNFDEGNHVAAGVIIAEIENDDLKAQLAEAEATAIARENEFARLMAGARPQERSAARAELREAEAQAAMARSNFDRRVALGEKQIVSKEQVDQARADRDTAEARRDLLSERLALLIAAPRSEDVSIAQANLNAAKARVGEITAQIEKTLVRSPIDGVILKLFHRAGETVTNLPPTPIVAVGDTSRLRVRADIDETDVAQIAIGQAVWITADAFRDKRFQGTVAQVGTQLGRKNFRNDNPEERVDNKILEVLIDLEPSAELPIGLPVDIKIAETIQETRKLSDVARRPVVPTADSALLARPSLR